MRRIVMIGTALVVLGAAASAYAAGNTYTATDTFTTAKAGSAKSPVTLGFTLKLGAKGPTGFRATPLTNIKNTFAGMVSNGKYFPTCSFNTIANLKNDTTCPKGARVATGRLTAQLGPAGNLSQAAGGVHPCARVIHVWNAGQGKLVFFFVGAPSTCDGLGTGSVGPFRATLKVQGGTLVLNVPLPSSVSFPLGPGLLAGSLETENLTYAKLTKKVNGKTIGFFESVDGCKSNKRAYSSSFTAAGVTGKVPDSAKCKK
jgi:hypothetical protein